MSAIVFQVPLVTRARENVYFILDFEGTGK